MSRSSTLTLCITLCFLAPARAAIITVTSDSGGTGGPDCTIRDAITAANTDTAIGGCPAGSGADTIELPADAIITLTMVDNQTSGPNGLPWIMTEITINGHGTTVARSSDIGAPAFRIFRVGPTGDLTLNQLTVYNGSALGGVTARRGGGIYNSGNLVLTTCILRSNSSVGRGAGIYSVGSFANLDLTDCLFEGNISSDYGGGIFNGDSELTCTDCRFEANSAVRGAGMWNAGAFELVDCVFRSNISSGAGCGLFNSGDGAVTDCLFVDNHGEGIGGGMWNSGTSVLRSCRFIRNSAFTAGGFRNYGDPLLMDCSFIGNIAWGVSTGNLGRGGAVRTQGFPIFVNCLFTGNQAVDWGGAMVNSQGVTLINCTMTGNIAKEVGGMYSLSSDQSTLANCILWGNDGVQFFTNGETSITYSDIEGGYVGLGNIDADPQFVDFDGLDNVPGNEDDDLRLQPGSPCIDAGDNTAVPEGIVTDLDSLPRFVDDPNTDDTGLGDPPIVDMGPYELQDPCADDDGDGLVTICHIPPGHSGNAHTITVSVRALPAHLAHGDQCGPCADGLAESAGGPATGSCCVTDGCFVLTEKDCAAVRGKYVEDGSRCVGPFELAQLLGWWGPCEPIDPCHDVDADANGNIGPFDLAVLLGVWGPCPGF